MKNLRPQKITYLFGAGATHAELANLEGEKVLEKEGLLMKDVSGRVMDQARRDPEYLKNLETVSRPKGPPNIELLISLIESSKVEGWEHKSQILKDLVRKDIPVWCYLLLWIMRLSPALS